MKIWIASSSRVKDSQYITLAHEVASFFASRGDELLCGGVNDSMMKEIFQTFKKNGRETSCCTLACYQEDLSSVDNASLLDSTFERTRKLYEMADIIVFLPGGTGSIAEIFASLEEYRTLESTKKLILYNYDNFYEPLIMFIKKLVDLGFNDSSILEKIIIVNTLEELEKKVS